MGVSENNFIVILKWKCLMYLIIVFLIRYKGAHTLSQCRHFSLNSEASGRGIR